MLFGIWGLGVNKTEKAIVRVGKSLGTLSHVLDQYDLDNGVPNVSSVRSFPGAERDRDMVIDELQKFSRVSFRSHPSFQKPKNMLPGHERNKLVQWIVQHIKY